MTSPFYRQIGCFLVFACLTAGLVIADEGDDTKGKGKGKKDRSEIVQVDLSKLHPGIAQYIRDHLETQSPKKKDDKKGSPEEKKGKKGEAKKEKEISLLDAVNLAARNGTVVKAERKGEGSAATFKIDVLDKEGAKTKLHFDAFGQPLDDKKGKGK